MITTVDPGRIECIVPGADQLGETPLWCDRHRKLWWLDIERPRLQSFDPASGAHEVHECDARFLGCLALGDEDSHLIALDLGLYRRPLSGNEVTLVARVEEGVDNRLNDGRVDARGRFWVGTMDNALQRPSGSLYRVDPDGTVERMLDGIIVSNGVAFSPDSRTLYFTDTRQHRSWRFDLDIDDGRIFNQRLFADYSLTGDRPDGACVDVDGGIWTAFFAGSRIVRYRPDGEIDVVVPVPLTNPTCVCFGGADLKTLYITSATKFLTPEQRASEPLAGSVLAVHGLAQGMPEHRFGFSRASQSGSSKEQVK